MAQLGVVHTNVSVLRPPPSVFNPSHSLSILPGSTPNVWQNPAQVIEDRVADTCGVHHKPGLPPLHKTRDTLTLNRPVELVETFDLQTQPGLRVNRNAHRPVGMLNDVTPHNYLRVER